jgi:cyclophilin family peptidyl-prolyl cis-trans isomerase
LQLKRLIQAALMLALAAGCTPGGNRDTTSTETAGTTAAYDTGTTQQDTASTAATTTTAASTSEETSMSNENQVAVLHTTAGDITIRFFPDVAPNHVKNFLDLSRSGFYNGTKFHRTIEGFMIQGGDPNTKAGDPSTWGMGGSPNNVNAEFNSISHKRGIVSMARSQSENSASSQFFIVVADSTFLDKKYTVFGQVTSGMEVADKIVTAPKSAPERPANPVSITSVELRPATPAEQGPAPK